MEASSAEQHIIKGRLDMIELETFVLVLLEEILSRATHALLSESSTGPFRFAHDELGYLLIHLQIAGVETHQLGAPHFVRKREIDGLSGSTWFRGRRGSCAEA